MTALSDWLSVTFVSNSFDLPHYLTLNPKQAKHVHYVHYMYYSLCTLHYCRSCWNKPHYTHHILQHHISLCVQLHTGLLFSLSFSCSFCLMHARLKQSDSNVPIHRKNTPSFEIQCNRLAVSMLISYNLNPVIPWIFAEVSQYSEDRT